VVWYQQGPDPVGVQVVRYQQGPDPVGVQVFRNQQGPDLVVVQVVRYQQGSDPGPGRSFQIQELGVREGILGWGAD